jgi:4-hydroxy-3-polyprenylbenzoate decarboxylase
MHTDGNETSPRVVIGMTGASGVIYGVRLLELLQVMKIETYLVITPPAQLTLQAETDISLDEVCALATHSFRTYSEHAAQDFAAPLASGSFYTSGMVIVPCSMKTLSAVAHSYADNLLTRAADVTLKEGRRLILVVRETPLHLGHLRLMVQAAEIGATIFPPVPAFYAHPATVDEMVTHTAGRILARLGFANDEQPVWGDE